MSSHSTDSETVIQALKKVTENPDQFNGRAQEIISLARRAVAALETPFEAFQRLAYSALPLVTTRIAQQHQVLKTLIGNTEKNGRNTTTAELAKKTGIAQQVLESLLEYMATQHIVEMVTLQEYKPSKRSYMLVEPLFIDGLAHFHDHCLPAHTALNSFLAGPGESRTAFEKGQHTGVDFYEWMDTRPTHAGAFHRFMELQFSSLPTWLDVIDFGSEYARDATNDTPIFVDVGGGNGQQCVSLEQRYPGIQGRIILQDRPRILANAISGAGVERMEYDFFTKQPVKNARAYYFRQIFHNHDDESCLRILRSHVPSMGESSALLIDDKVLSDEEGDRAEYTAGLGVSMLCMFNALERRESQWRALFGEVGLRIKEIRRFTGFRDSVIVAIKG